MGKKKSSGPQCRNPTRKKSRSRSNSPQPGPSRRRPIPWLIQLLSYFNIFAPAAPQDDRIKADLFLEVEDDGTATGRFRWVLSGSRHITATFKASDVIPGPRREDYDLVWAIRPQDIKLAQNMTSTPWLDLADLVAKGHVTATHDGEEASHDFLGKYIQALTLSGIPAKSKSDSLLKVCNVIFF
jgi:hypothetical protein